MVDFKKDKAKKVDFLRVKDSRTGDIRKVISPSKFEVGLPDSDFSKGMKVQGPIEIVEVLSPSTANRLYVTDNDLYWSGTKIVSGAADIESVTAGVGLSGGGSSGAISIALDTSELTALGTTAATSDFAVIQDVTDDSTKKVLISNIPITPAGSDTQIQFNDNGSLGASSAFTIDDIGAVKKPSNPSFLATLGSITSTLSTAAAQIDVVFGTERFDLNADYNTSTGVFTAPVTGKYLFAVEILFQHFDTGATYYSVNIVTSNRTYFKRIYPNNSWAEPTYWPQQTTVIADMDANDTAKVTVQQNGGTAQTEIYGSSTVYTWFAGSLIN